MTTPIRLGLAVLLAAVFGANGLPADEPDLALLFGNKDQFAWQVFVEICRPHESGDGSTKWEHWALARKVYLKNPDPAKPPTWKEATRAGESPSERFEKLPLQQLVREIDERDRGKSIARVLEQRQAAFDPVTRVGDENDEVRMNPEAFDFVVSNALWYVEGQEAMLGRREKIEFPVPAKEIKAQWKFLGLKSKLGGQFKSLQDDYHTAQFTGPDDTELWGLVALHITTKDLPNWVWATWEHKNNPLRESVVPSVDRFGAKVNQDGLWTGPTKVLQDLFVAKKLPKKWENYVLRGTQIDFVDPRGVPTILANSIVEEGFQETSSCITCHAKATIGPRRRRSDVIHRLPVFHSNDPPIGDIGQPDPAWFARTDTSPPAQLFWQTDFVWSMIRADRLPKQPGPTESSESSESTGQSGAASAFSRQSSVSSSRSDTHPLVGDWAYRAFFNDPQDDTTIDNDFVLGNGVLTIESVDRGVLRGKLTIDESSVAPQRWSLRLSGNLSTSGDEWNLEFEGVGSSAGMNDSGPNRWHYQYEGKRLASNMMFASAAGENGRVPVLQGSVQRVVRHLNGKVARLLRDREISVKDVQDKDYYPAGFTGSWYAVKKPDRDAKLPPTKE